MEVWFFSLVLVFGLSFASSAEVVTCSTTSLQSCESFIGQSVIFQCTPESAGVKWKLNEIDISNDTHYNIDFDNGTLTIQEVRSIDNGSYNCGGSGSISLRVKTPVIIIGQYTDLTVGSSVSINCTTMPSIPNSDIKWHSSSFNTTDSNVLVISPVMLSHNDNTFTCTVSSVLLAMKLMKSITISVLDTSVSSVTVQPLSSSYVIGDNVSIVCTINLTNAIGPDVSSLVANWFKNKEMITTNTTNNNDLSLMLNSILTLTQVSPTDAGVYTCKASIDGSDIELTDSTNLCLKVNETVTKELSLGQNSIDCITGPVPTGVSVSWLLTNGSIYSNDNTLMIPSILPSHDNTQYTCTIMIETNPSDCSTQSQVITFRVKATYINSVTVLPTSVLSYFINSTVVLTCTINLNTGIGPDISFISHYWYQHSVDISDRSTPLMINGDSKSLVTTLVITNVQLSDAGDYQCRASIDGNDTVISKTARLCIQVNETLPSVTKELSLGQYYSIDCITGPIPTGVSVSWLLTNDSIYSNNNTLMIPSILPSHNNTQYNCTIMIETNPSDCSTQSQVITLRVKATYINSVTVLPTPIVRFINSTVVLTCTVSLNTGIGPDISFISHYWYQHSTDISDRSTPLMINGDSKSLVTTLNIDSVQLSDAGDYQCGASIDANNTFINSTAHFCVQVPAINNSDDTNLRLGDIMKYDCTLGYRYSGFDVHWVKNGSNKRLNNPLILTVDQSINNTLYICYIPVINPSACPVQQVNISITVKDTAIKTVVTNTDSLVLSNTSHQLDCHITTNTDINITNTDINTASTNSIVHVSWYRNNGNENRLVSDSGGVSILPIVSVNDTSFISTLRFSPITSSTPVSTLGNYTCVAWIGEQSVRSKTSKNVQIMMKIDNSKDNVNLTINHISGREFSATCMVTTCQQSPFINTKITVVIKGHNNNSTMYSREFNNNNINDPGTCLFFLSINFTEIYLSNTGRYICYFLSSNSFVELNHNISDDANLTIKIPNMKEPNINSLESYYEVGMNVSLSCLAYPKENYIDVGTNITLQWSNLSNHVLASSSTHLTNLPATINYTINNVNLSNAGQYNCSSFIDTTNDDDYILTSDTNTSLVNVSVIIPNEINSMISIDPVNSMNSYYDVGSTITLTCSIVYDRSSYIDINTKIYMEWVHGRSILNTTTNLTTHSFNFTIDELELSDTGQYNCSYYIFSTISNPNIGQSERKFDIANISTIIPIKDTSLILNPLQPYYEVGSEISLSCYATNTNPFLDDTNTAIDIKWTFQEKNLNQSFVHKYNENFTHKLTNVALSGAGTYKCTYHLTSKINNPYIEPSDDTSKVTNVIIKIPNGDSPRIIGNLNYFSVGKNIDLFCVVTYQDYPLIPLNVNMQWLNSSNHTLHSYTGINNYTQRIIRLTINNVSLSDAGEYTCQYNISSTNNSFVLPSDSMTASTNVSIKIPNNKVPVINLIPHQSEYDTGSNITLSCSVTYPRSSLINTYLTLQWFNSLNQIINSSTIINDYNGYTLTYTISNARLSDAGQYTCSFFINTSAPHIVTSDATKKFITINITIPNVLTPSIQLHPSKSYYNVNDSITLSCIINYPTNPLTDVDTTVNIQWLNYSLDRLDSYTELNDHTEDAEHSFDYTINNLKLTDAGQYTCSFSISTPANANIIRSNVSYSVINISMKIPDGENPSVTQLKSYYRVGDNIILTCSATYSSYIATNMNIQWLNSSNNTLHSYTGINTNTDHTISYTINNVSLSDAGEYTCQFNISTDRPFILPSNNMRSLTDVFIQIPDKIPMINPIPHKSVYNTGSDITLSCSVTYLINIDTYLTLQWFNSSNQIVNSSTIINDYNEHTLTYTISNARLSDAGQYTCSFFINSSVPHIVSSNVTSNFITVNIKIPNVLTPSIQLHPSKSYYNVNDNITLSCIIHYPTNPLIDVDTTVNIQWLNYSLDSYRSGLNDQDQHTFSYNISSLKLSHAGRYTCSFFLNATMNNDIIEHSKTNSNYTDIIIILPRGTISSITISQDDPLFGVGSNAVLSCSVYYANSSFIDVDTTVHIEWKHNGVLLDSHSTGNTFSNVSFDYHLSDVNNEEYTCESYLSATDDNPFIKNSNITSNTTIVTEALAVPVVVGFIFFGIILIVIIGVVALIICWLKIRGLKPSGVKVKSKELYTFSRELTKEDTDITETYALTLNEESLYQNVKATASTHKRPINSFPSFVKSSKKEIEDEYEDIETLAPSKSDSIAKSHALKNRFQNISPFDDNIVPLVEIKGQEGSNYINASYVSGYCRHRAYIATQGPIPSTVVDFWRMVWEYKLPTIVMLTQLVEKGINKCACYWPEDLNSEQDIGEGMKLTLKSEEVNHGYSKRKLCIKIESDDGEESSLNVTQYHFTEWPDHGVPVDKIVMISFIDNIRSTHPPKGPPLVVHCSAGVGRTGTFIVMDTMLQKMKEEDSLNIYELVLQIRHQRMKLVQTQAQYMYIHESLAEYIQCGDTSFLITDAYHKIKDLNKSTDDGKTGFQKEFELLKELTDYTGTLSCSDAEENQDKNRFTYNLPYNNTRVCLMTTDEEDENNYINASRITGYKRNSLFIATQLPMKNTVNDFWKMVWQERCGTIVLLCPFPQTTEAFSFWPAQVKTSCEYDSTVVTLKSMIEDIGFNAYSLEIKTGDETGSSRQFCLFHYQEWPADASRPKPGSSLVSLFESVVKNQSKTGNKPIVVICNDGVGCSGTFLTAYSQIERAKTEGVSDIFQFIRKARSQRPGLVDCLDQYIYCHEIISDFAEDMSQYDNFKRYI